VVNHEILVFIGEQGNYKTTWFQRLLPPSLRRYFHIRVRQGKLDKDDVLRLSKYWMSCLEEIDEMSPSELNTLKAMVTVPNIDERPFYGRNDEHAEHIASFCATGNNPRFLIDRTGNRRWLVFLVKDIASPYTSPIDYDGFFAQLYALYRQGFQYWFEREEIAQLSVENERFEAPNMERELILTYYRVPQPGETGTFATISDIIARIGMNIKQVLSAQKVGVEMTKLGFEKTKKNGMRGYVVIEYTMDQVIANRHFTREPDATDQKLPF
jgi:predicted P-loop ATPase